MHYSNLGETAFLTPQEIAVQISQGDTVAIGGFWFVRLPIALVDALIDRGVCDLTIVTQASGLAVEQLVAAGLVKKVIYSFVSLDLLGTAPRFRAACQSGMVAFEEWTALQMNNALEAGRLGMSCGVLQPPEGSAFDSESDWYHPAICPFTGKRIGMVRVLRPQVALLHAQQADTQGNIAIFGSLGIDELYLGAADRAFVSVEELVQPGGFTADPRAHLFAHFLVSGVSVQPGGAYPTSCLPYYATDYHALLAGQYTNQPQLPDRMRQLGQSAQMRPVFYQTRLATLPSAQENPAWSVDELMVCVMAAQLRNHMVTTVGSNTPLALVAYLLAKGTHAPDCTLIPFCGLVDMPYGPVSLSFAEPLAFHASTVHWGIADLWQWIYQKSLTAVEFGGCAQLDQYGCINNSQIRDNAGNVKVLLPGQAGLADILNLHHNAYYYVTRHQPRSICEAVSFAGGSFQYVSMEERTRQGLADGVMRVITDLCVLELDRVSRRLKVVQLHPGVSREQVQAQTGFEIAFAPALTVTQPPSPHQLAKIRREIDPFGYRRLAFLSGDERTALLQSILAQESALLGDSSCD